MAPQNPETAALLAHVVSQLESNVQFLVSQNYISSADASAFLTKLPNTSNNNSHTAHANTNSNPVNSLASRLRNLTNGGGAGGPPTPPRASVPQARAMWAYNEHGQDADDLSFAAGDIIDIIEETNADWWMGRVHGRQALFPSSYVQKIQPASTPAPPAVAPGMPAARANKPVYKPFGAAHHGADAPPPSGAGVNSVGLQQEAGTEEKKNKFGKYGNTMAHSAAGGVGFGAGAAIGGGLVRAIF
ncbi:SH3 domain-containing protein [Collybia nuda]|uniref:SH3 domain-containing protein n=1 Tax=Collybia nuda TaxID=64659 RepID=A0A9P5Y9Q2_9AGAR|nr:SH3 domain-containing protein [Collybia nuda]